MHMKMCIHSSTKTLLRKLASYKVCLCLLLCKSLLCTAWFYGDQIFMDFVRFLIHDDYEVLCTWCLKCNIFSAWFLDIRTLTCYSYNLVNNNHCHSSYYYFSSSLTGYIYESMDPVIVTLVLWTRPYSSGCLLIGAEIINDYYLQSISARHPEE